VPRTLIVDDDHQTEPLFRKHLSRLWAQRQEQFIFAESDERALEILETGTEFNIALVAIDRERVSGMGLFQKLKNRSLRVPRIALTSGEDLAMIRKAMNSGAADFLAKPFSLKILLSRLTELSASLSGADVIGASELSFLHCAGRLILLAIYSKKFCLKVIQNALA
jgi:DNA-binding NtrC family response regulator